MGRGTWYYSLGVFLAIVDALVRSEVRSFCRRLHLVVFFSFWNRVIFGSIPIGACEFEISSWRGVRVDVRTYLLGGAIDGSEANGIIHDPKLELESSPFTFDLVPLSYKSVDVVVGENYVPKELVGFTPRRRIGFRMELVQGAKPICEGSCHLTSLERQEVWTDCRSYKVRVGLNGNLLWEAFVLLGRKKDTLKFTAMPFGLTNAPAIFMELMSRSKEEYESHAKLIMESLKEEKMYVKFFQQHGSGAKRKLSRCRRNQMGNEPILALPKGADDFVVYYDARSKDFEACLEKGRRLTNRWLSMKKDITSCGSKYLAYLDVEVEYQGSSGLLPEELSGVHDTFHVSKLKKCLADASLHVPLGDIKVDKTLRFVEERMEIIDCEVKSLKRSKIALVKVRWDSKRG
ncbi:hypothetical protein Tco_1101612 [Tanacetum coccineum]